MTKKIFAIAAAVLCSGALLQAQTLGKDARYCNPLPMEIGQGSASGDVSVFQWEGKYYMFCTGGGAWVSEDMLNWDYHYVADVPVAPDVCPYNGKFYMTGNSSNVWVADNPLGPFVDHGKIIDAKKLNVENSIDQFYFEEKGKKYLFWGSFFGLYAVELNKDGLSVKCNADGTPVVREKIAGNAYEASCVYKKGKYYYLFASIGSCCEGANSTYQTVVGRSESLFGPYVNRSGRRMLDNQHEILIYANENFVGCGHNSIIQQDDAGQTWIIFHGYVRSEADNGRYVFLNQLYWDEEGWPYVENAVAAPKAFAPVINP